MSDRELNSLFVQCKKIIPKVSKDLLLSCIDSELTVQFNPIKEFFDKHKHRNKTGLIKKLAESINTKTGYSSRAQFPEYAEYFIRKWMIGAVAMWHGKHSPLMLILAGSKQNTGKSHFFRYLLPDEFQPYYGEAELTGDKDENLLMCTKALIMNDEMSNKSKRDITVLKQLCSKKWFNLRKPYGKMSEDFRRIAALAGTSNSMELLNDPTGNRRLIPIEVISIDHDKYNSVDKTDLWVEAYHAFKAGESFELTNKDIEILSSATTEFEEASLEGELLMRFFEPNGSMKMTNSEIKYYIEVRTNQRLNQRKLGMELKRCGFEKSVERIRGVVKQLYSVSETREAAITEPIRKEKEDDKAPF
jgi:predicted P-loop ATPase